jgi:DNA modification methylase
LEIIYKSPSELKPFQKNPYNHPEKQLSMLKKSMREFGFTSPVLISQDNMVIAGHARLKAAQEIGLSEVPTIFIDLPYEKAVAYVIADNQLAKLAEEDRDLLGELLQGINDIPDFDIEAVGFSSEDIDTLLKSGDVGEVVEDEFNEDDVGEGRCKEGDLWQLGRHFLLCGDSTKKEDVEKLIQGAKIDLLLTDPPYGVAIVTGKDKDVGKIGAGGPRGFGKIVKGNIVPSKTYKKIKGDETTDTAENAYKVALETGIKNMIIWGGNYFTAFLPPSMGWIVWDKENPGNCFSDVELAWTSFDKAAKLYKWLWNGLSRKGDRASELVSRVHPTQKPVGLHCEIIRDFTQEGANILDLFLGSGTTLIACEQTGRTCYGIEYEKEYCDVILSRWEQFTNQTAKKLN